MRKRTMILGVMLVLMMVVCVNAYAMGETSAWEGFWNSVGGFLYNAMPWNWGNWWGK